jgi:hypothetical protein
MSYVQMAMAVVGTVAAVSSAQQQAKQAQQAADYNSALNKRNAEIANQNAAAARRQAVADSEAQRRSAEKQLGSMRAGYAASGIQMEGTPLDVLSSSVQQAEMDTLNTIYKGELRANSYQNEASGLSLTSQLDESSGKSARTQGMYSAGSSILSGAEKAYSIYANN